MVSVPLRVRPGASRTRVGGAHPGPYGTALVVAVTVPAVDGRANRAVIEAVAEALGVRRADVTLRLGERGRDKLAEIADPPADLAARIAALLGPRP